jgi:hypothetical protein
MESSRLEELLAPAEAAVADGSPPLAATGFWKAVAAAKRDASLRERYAARLAAIDRSAFEHWALLRIGIRPGTWIMLAATAVAIGIVGVAYAAPEPWDGILLLASTVGLVTTTHGLAHLAVGSIAGIKFTHWFIGSATRPQPGVKIDYESYLAAPARRRAQMHAAGAVVSKLMPFLLLGAALGMDAPLWAWVGLIIFGVVQVVTDLLWSVKASDWKRYQREMRYVD